MLLLPPWQEETVYWDDEVDTKGSTDATQGADEPQSPEPSITMLEDIAMMGK